MRKPFFILLYAAFFYGCSDDGGPNAYHYDSRTYSEFPLSAEGFVFAESGLHLFTEIGSTQFSQMNASFESNLSSKVKIDNESYSFPYVYCGEVYSSDDDGVEYVYGEYFFATNVMWENFQDYNGTLEVFQVTIPYSLELTPSLTLRIYEYASGSTSEIKAYYSGYDQSLKSNYSSVSINSWMDEYVCSEQYCYGTENPVLATGALTCTHTY